MGVCAEEATDWLAYVGPEKPKQLGPFQGGSVIVPSIKSEGETKHSFIRCLLTDEDRDRAIQLLQVWLSGFLADRNVLAWRTEPTVNSGYSHDTGKTVWFVDCRVAAWKE